ncbi:hypothetical protein H1230_09310 [Paenibacillus sp. 19GGS1-52]|uniref:pyocin knob domain-containing protein n=1 Tax=Paenibacillus sp. 19GGS1-52 TaxID=2758563 RepID=UPI001EFAEF56|nr:pyocin knob domain-containing protein [Paenibacillus sp. 19GGS1-52]ULO08944.1 hypothetical protein H1230_09310 [Paenibacillus sp. 19GGS1-52]
MADFNEKLPEWQEPGIEPPTSRKTMGWQVNDKPPAGWLNWLFNRIYVVLVEIRSVVSTHKAVSTIGVHGSASAATPNTLIHRDAAGRAQVVAPSAAGDIAIKSTVDNAITALSNATLIPAATNLDTMLTEGNFYMIGTTGVITAITNRPAVSPIPFGLQVVNTGGTTKRQIYRPSTTALTKTYLRNYAGSWGSWYEDENTSAKNVASGYAGLDATSKVPRVNTYSDLGGASVATDLNAILDAGTCSTGPSTLNQPGVETYGTVVSHVSVGDTHNNSSNWIWQMFYGAGGNTYVRRKVNSGAWTDWVFAWTGYNDTILFKIKQKIVDGTDYNNLVAPGSYEIFNLSGTNMSPVTYGVLNVTVTVDNYILQEATSINAPQQKYYRARNETLWGPWQRVLSTEYMGAGSGIIADTIRGYMLDQNLRTTDTPTFNGVNFLRANNYKLGTDLPSTYQLGESIFFCNNVAGFPAMYGTVVTTRSYSAMATVQYFYPYNTDAPIKYRYSLYPTDAWLAWRDVIDSSTYTAADVLAKLKTVDGAGSGTDSDMLDGWHASQSAVASNVAVRDTNKKIAEVSATRVRVTEVVMAATTQTLATYTPTVQGNYTISVCLAVTTATTVVVNLTYTDRSGATTVVIIPSTLLPVGSWSGIPVFIAPMINTAIAVTVTSSAAGTVYASATIKED